MNHGQRPSDGARRWQNCTGVAILHGVTILHGVAILHVCADVRADRGAHVLDWAQTRTTGLHGRRRELLAAYTRVPARALVAWGGVRECKHMRGASLCKCVRTRLRRVFEWLHWWVVGGGWKCWVVAAAVAAAAAAVAAWAASKGSGGVDAAERSLVLLLSGFVQCVRYTAHGVRRCRDRIACA